MSLHRTSRSQIRRAAPTLAGAGGWATVVSEAAGQVRVTYDRFDGGLAAFGPLPCWPISGTQPAAGDSVWLLVDSQGEPQLAIAA